MAANRYRIGLLLNSCSSPQNMPLWQGVMDAAGEIGATVITYSRGSHTSSNEVEEAIYRLVDPRHLDGLIVSCTLPLFNPDPGSTTRADVFLARLGDLPVVSYGAIAADIPGVLVDNVQGTRAAVEHLVQDHGLKRVAFINGDGNRHDQRLRYHTYCDVLQEYGLPVDPALVIAPEAWTNAQDAVRTLFDLRGVTPDAVIGSNDETAIAMHGALQDYGLRVPTDVAVVGFDDIEHSRVITPPLTTISLRAYSRGYHAITLVREAIERGRDHVPVRVTLPTHLVVRESCGCLTPAIARAASRSALSDEREALIADIAAVIPAFPAATPSIELLVSVLDGPAIGRDKRFLIALEDALKSASESGVDISTFQDVVSILCNAFPDTTLTSLWHQARVMVGDRARRAQSYRDWQARERSTSLTQFGQVLAATPDLDRMLDILATELPQQGISFCAMALYLDTSASPMAQLIFTTAGSWTGDTPASPTDLLRQITTGVGDTVVEPLRFQDQELGFVVFSVGPRDGELYDTIAQQLSSAIKIALLMQSNVQLYEQARADHRRAEEADRLKSRFLLTVSHEIRTPLALLIGLSEMLMREGLDDRPSLPPAYRKDLSRIHLGAQQLDGLMRDVMDLARSQVGRLKLVKKHLSLREVLLTATAAGEAMAAEKGLDWTYDLPEYLPMISGDRVRLQQVIFNLISNAVKYTDRGSIHLGAQVKGESIIISVSDTGIGIPQAEHQVIFDEFEQSTNTRGYGGLGLGLAICRRLIELHGGTIGVRDNPGGGSVFFFSLPASQEVRHVARTQHDEVLVLVPSGHDVGDLVDHLAQDSVTLRIVHVHVDENDFDPDASWLVDIFARPPGALILAIDPDAGWGWEIVAVLKEEPATQDIPILFFGLMNGGVLLDMDTVTKPVRVDALGSILQKYSLHNSLEDKPVVLIADDETSIREMHATIVHHHLPDGRILQAYNGEVALKLLHTHRVDLVLLDLMMPEMDGFALLEKMQADTSLRRIPVIVVTAQVLVEEDMQRLNRGVAQVLAKGVFKEDEIREQVARILERRQGSSEGTKIVRQSMAYIHSHDPETLSRGDIARHVGVSEGHLTRCFRRETGLSPITYLNRYRIEQAQRMLSEQVQSITAIASSVGFSESSYFTRVFRRETGLTPSEYQQMHDPS